MFFIYLIIHNRKFTSVRALRKGILNKLILFIYLYYLVWHLQPFPVTNRSITTSCTTVRARVTYLDTNILSLKLNQTIYKTSLKSIGVDEHRDIGYLFIKISLQSHMSNLSQLRYGTSPSISRAPSQVLFCHPIHILVFLYVSNC